MFKVGSQLFTTEGPRAVQKLAGLGFDIFLDLKFHDIPNTVAGAVAAAAKLPRVRLVNVHASGGVEMMRAAREAAGSRKSRPALLAVTILTSLDAKALRDIGMSGSPASRATALAQARQKGRNGRCRGVGAGSEGHSASLRPEVSNSSPWHTARGNALQMTSRGSPRLQKPSALAPITSSSAAPSPPPGIPRAAALAVANEIASSRDS